MITTAVYVDHLSLLWHIHHLNYMNYFLTQRQLCLSSAHPQSSPLDLRNTLLNDQRHFECGCLLLHQVAQLHPEHRRGRQVTEAGERGHELLQKGQLHIQQTTRLQTNTQLLTARSCRRERPKERESKDKQIRGSVQDQSQ